ncbi:DnaD domain protein [Halobacillus litoralis]|uniref:DnaD domain protein n=1 Tax=Halobacillus litoralis TaxID=45668 RepID=UPI001CD41CD6|nr:DnaD domain protein [Halobacillus litoralis]MCA0970827.1 DnaD domain protein [Halobacillus litoralis]
MNYIKAINSFYDHQEFNPLSAHAINLWHGLMHVNNKSRWKEEFCVSMTVLCMKTGISESSARKARKELVEKGYITFTSREGNQAPLYQIIPLYEEEQNDTPIGSSNDKPNGNSNGSWNTLSKQNETKENETDDDARPSNAHTFYESNIGSLSPYIAEQVTQWCDELSEDLVIEALKRSVQNNKPFFRYAEAILKQWQREGVRSIHDTRKPDRKPPKENLFDKLRKEVQA